MKVRLTAFARRYRTGLRAYLQHAPKAGASPAQRLGRQALASGLETLDLAQIHDQALMPLVADCPARTRATRIKRARRFFAEVITPIEKTHRAARQASVRLGRLNQDLRQRSRELADSNRRLHQQVAQRQATEKALRQSEQHYSRLWKQSRHLQDQLRSLSHQILSAQEEERKKISRELHDQLVQTLTGITLRLAALRAASSAGTKSLRTHIIRTQRLVERSVDIVHRFARELRPTMLDDLGLIPALQSFVRSFAARTGIRVHLTAAAAVEQLDGVKRTALYRVAQEALTNVTRHARATRVTVDVRKLAGSVRLIVRDNGCSFQVQRVSRAAGHKRLGLLGMRERVEMVGGRFHVESVRGRGTTIRALVPCRSRAGRKRAVREP